MEHDNIGYINLVGGNGLFVAYKVIFLKVHMLVTAHPRIFPHLERTLVIIGSVSTWLVTGVFRIQSNIYDGVSLRKYFRKKIES